MSSEPLLPLALVQPPELLATAEEGRCSEPRRAEAGPCSAPQKPSADGPAELSPRASSTLTFVRGVSGTPSVGPADIFRAPSLGSSGAESEELVHINSVRNRWRSAMAKIKSAKVLVTAQNVSLGTTLDLLLGSEHPWLPPTQKKKKVSFVRSSSFKEVLSNDSSQRQAPDSVAASASSKNLSTESPTSCRFLDRAPDHPTYGQRHRANVVRLNRESSLFFQDLFHVFLEIPAGRFLIVFWLVYCLCFLLFATIYWLLGDRCDLGIKSFIDAVFLSVETMMTIGYGVPDPFFKSCPWIAFVLIVQCLLSVSLDASLVGIIYQRVSRGGRRASTLLFSDKAVIRKVEDAYFFMFQVCEMRKSQLLSSHVRCYLVTRPHPQTEPRSSAQTAGIGGSADEDVPVEFLPMRLEQPDDALGAMIFMVFPTRVVHRIDMWSPLAGRPGSSNKRTRRQSSMEEHSPWAPMQRSSDCLSGNRYSVSCAVCGDCFYHTEQLRAHVRYSARTDKLHSEFLERLPREKSAQGMRESTERFFVNCHVEVVCIVEGIDPVSSSSVQARHSYTAEDIVWDHDFAHCVYDADFGNGQSGYCIDFDRFDDLVPCSKP